MPVLKTNTCAVASLPAYPAVSVAATATCCDAAKALHGQVMLASEAPILPRHDCTDPRGCQCRYRKYPDRRMGDEDRRFPYEGQRATWFNGAEQRSSRGRRDED